MNSSKILLLSIAIVSLFSCPVKSQNFGGMLKKKINVPKLGKSKSSNKNEKETPKESEPKQTNGSVSNAMVKQLDLFDEISLTFEQYKNNIGKVIFSNEEFERQLPESKYLKTYTIGDKLGFRSFMKNSPANSIMLQLEASGKDVDEINDLKSLLKRAGLFYKLYFDGEYIASTNASHRFDSEEISSLATNRGDLKDDNGVYFGETLYDALLKKEELLTPGIHKLRLVLYPAYQGSSSYQGFEFKELASGEVNVDIKEGASYVKLDECFPKAKMNDTKTESEITKVVNGQIVSGSKLRDVRISSRGWKIIKDPYNRPVKKMLRSVLIYTDAKNKTFYTERIFEKLYAGGTYGAMQFSSDARIEGEGIPISRPRTVHSECAKLLK